MRFEGAGGSGDKGVVEWGDSIYGIATAGLVVHPSYHTLSY